MANGQWLMAVYWLLNKFAVLNSVWGSVHTLQLLPLLVLRVRTLVEDYIAIALEREDVGCDTIQEPTVVRDNYCATCEVLQALLQCTKGVYVDVVGRLIEQDYIALLLQCQCEVQAVALTTREYATLLLLVCTGEVEACNISASRHLTVAQLYELAVLRDNLVNRLLRVD